MSFRKARWACDECLPTIAPCVWQGRELPITASSERAWKVDWKRLEHGILKTSVRLEISPFDFERTLSCAK